MNKELEALEKLANTTVASKIGNWGMEYTKVKDFSYAQPLLDIIRKALTPPTSDEVCEALSAYYDDKVSYSNERYNHMFYFEGSKLGIIRLIDSKIYFIQSDYHKTNILPPHLITLIGRFYEGVEKK